MKCPRCKAPIDTPVNPEGIIPCPGCGARLMTRAAALRSQGGPRPAGGPTAAPPPASTARGLEEHPPSATLPPPAGVTVRRRRASAEPEAETGEEPKEADRQRAKDEAVTLETLRRDILALQAAQVEMLDLVRQLAQGATAGVPADAEEGSVLSPVRSRRRKSVLLVDDDGATRDAAVAALQQADVPVRALAEGHAALQAIAAEKPDVIAIELALGGEMAGKDVINMIKATMEWVDIPVVLWTREDVGSQKDARLIHGADELVRKESGAEALVASVITLFRRA